MKQKYAEGPLQDDDYFPYGCQTDRLGAPGLSYWRWFVESFLAPHYPAVLEYAQRKLAAAEAARQREREQPPKRQSPVAVPVQQPKKEPAVLELF